MPHQPEDVVTRAELGQLERNAIQFQVDLSSVVSSHLREFTDSLDTQDLIEFATAQGVPLRSAYDLYVKDRREAKSKELQTAALNAAREEGRQEALRSAQPGPYPPPSQANAVLAQINRPVDANEYGVNAAVAEYNKIVSGR